MSQPMLNLSPIEAQILYSLMQANRAGIVSELNQNRGDQQRARYLSEADQVCQKIMQAVESAMAPAPPPAPPLQG